jgi:cytochrome P450
MPAGDQPRVYPFETFRGDLPCDLLEMVVTRPVSRVTLPDGRHAWLVVGYDEVCQVLSDPRFSRYASRATPPPVGAGGGTSQAAAPGRELTMDGPEHTSLRRLASRAFTPRRMASLRPRVQALTDLLLDKMAAGGPPADVVASLVAPLPVLVICDLLGVRAGDSERFQAWAADIVSVTAYGSASASRARARLRAYLADCLAAKRVSPGDDLLSEWLTVQAEEKDLTDTEIVGLAFGVLLGGREVNSTSSGLRVLFQHPAEFARLRADPGRLPAVVEEILRYTSVSPMFLVQTLLEDAELGGVTMSAGDALMAVPWAANRDPARFPGPNVFDPDRPAAAHLAFGYGPHYCLGAALGKLEIEVALGTLLRRFPRLAPAVPLDRLQWRNERFNCGLAEFPVTW